jgi:hypothetical protein
MLARMSTVLGLAPLFAVFVLGGFYYAWQHYLRPRIAGRTWVTLAPQLGLELEPYEPAHHGVSMYAGPPSVVQAMSGRRGSLQVIVKVTARVVRHRRSRSVEYSTGAHARSPASLGLGLRVQALGMLDRLSDRLTGIEYLALGDDRSTRSIGSAPRTRTTRAGCCRPRRSSTPSFAPSSGSMSTTTAYGSKSRTSSSTRATSRT